MVTEGKQALAKMLTAKVFEYPIWAEAHKFLFYPPLKVGAIIFP